MKKPWSKPTISRLDITSNYSKEITMKRLVLVSLAALMFVAPAVVFFVNGGRVKAANLTLKQDRGIMTVKPTGVTIRPQ